MRAPSSKEGIEAASRTYNRCTSLLREALEMDPTDLGLGPRDTFEETVTIARALLERERPTGERENLTKDDFSFNEVLRLMRLTAIRMAGPKRLRVTREEFIRRVNAVLQEDGGLEVSKRIVPNAKTGRYAWIEEHMQKFLHRNNDVVRRSKKHTETLRIMAAS